MSLKHNDLTGIIELKKVVELDTLDLTGNQKIKDLQVLKECPRREELTVWVGEEYYRDRKVDINN